MVEPTFLIMKYKLTKETKTVHGVKLHRIQAVKSFRSVNKGELGGWIESESNLNHSGNAWVSDNARVCDNAEVGKSKDYLCIGPLGSDRYITLSKSNSRISAGCFHGSFDDFKYSVDEKYNGESDYYMVFPLIKKYFGA